MALNILAGVLVVLAAGMLFVSLFVSLFAEVSAVGQQMSSPLAQFAWAAAWGLFAAVGLCALLVPGFILCVRPAWVAVVAPAPAAASVRRWPRLTGLTYVWAGVWFITLALTTLAQAFRVPREFPPAFSNMAFVSIFAVAVVPAYSVVLAGRLVRPARSQRPVAEDDPPSHQSE